jgi:tetrachlorobenzoquinone reductase
MVAGYVRKQAFEKQTRAMTENPDSIGGFEVRLHRSGRTIPIPPGKTILKTLLDAGVDVDFSCAMGGCGTCETRIVEGIPDHRDLYLSEEEKAENNVIMICCSGSKSPVLVLDL